MNILTRLPFQVLKLSLNSTRTRLTEDQIIGHFGFGFYSAFMVADRVTIDTFSYQKDANGSSLWDCEGGTEYDMRESDKADPSAQKITLYLK